MRKVLQTNYKSFSFSSEDCIMISRGRIVLVIVRISQIFTVHRRFVVTGRQPFLEAGMG